MNFECIFLNRSKITEDRKGAKLAITKIRHNLCSLTCLTIYNISFTSFST